MTSSQRLTVVPIADGEPTIDTSDEDVKLKAVTMVRQTFGHQRKARYYRFEVDVSCLSADQKPDIAESAKLRLIYSAGTTRVPYYGDYQQDLDGEIAAVDGYLDSKGVALWKVTTQTFGKGNPIADVRAET